MSGVGKNSVLFSGVVVYPYCQIGEGVRLHAGSVIGSDGFGYHIGPHGIVKLPHVGRVVIEDYVEVGANTCIDRALIDETRIGKNTKIDNLVQVGHNCIVGEANIIVSQVGLSGSVRTGRNVILAGQVGVADHVEIGDGAVVSAKAGVSKSLEGGKVYGGLYPLWNGLSGKGFTHTFFVFLSFLRGKSMRVRIAHSPDSDDAFMFYALTAGKIDTEGLQVEHVLADIETLNRQALKGTYEVSALSFHAYPYVAGMYLVLPSGGSVGDGYGPIVVARQELKSLRGLRIGVPGKLTTAYLVLRLYEPEFEEVVLPFDRVLDAVKEGRLDAGLVIHEGQLSYEEKGLVKVLDLGEWWKKETGLPLPLGCNIIRKDLGWEVIKKFERLMRRSVEYALSHTEEALSFAKEYARDIKEDDEKTRRFVGMYVNERTLDYGEEGRRAVRLLLEMGISRGIIKASMPKVIFSDEV